MANQCYFSKFRTSLLHSLRPAHEHNFPNYSSQCRRMVLRALHVDPSHSIGRSSERSFPLKFWTQQARVEVLSGSRVALFMLVAYVVVWLYLGLALVVIT